MEQEVPQYITSGYPPKVFKFLEWEIVETGGRNAARRNKTRVSMPVYEAADGEKLLLPLYSKKL